jgi:arylsulfatase
MDTTKLFTSVLTTAVMVASLSLATSSARAADAPNIVLIMSDDMGFSDIGCYGSEINTPNLDQLANHGVRFSQFYNAARCCPTRAALLSGVYQHQAGIGLMTGDKKLPGYRGELGRNVVSIAEALSTAGYRRYMAGKLARHAARRPGRPQG